MLVQGWMTNDVITVDEDSTIRKASIIMKEKKIRCLPVVNAKGELLGIVSDRDLRDASPSNATTPEVSELPNLLSSVKIKDVMTTNFVYVRPDETIEFAAILMLENKVSSLPVIDDKRGLTGIITQTDILQFLINIAGVYTGGIQFAFSLEDRPGSLREAADMIRSHGGRIVSILSTRETAEEGRRNVYIRSSPLPDQKLRVLVKELEKRFVTLYTSKDLLEEVENRRVRVT